MAKGKLKSAGVKTPKTKAKTARVEGPHHSESKASESKHRHKSSGRDKKM